MSRIVLIGASPVLEHQARVLLGDDIVAVAPASVDVLLARIVALPTRPQLLLLGDRMTSDVALSVARAVRQLTDVVGLVSEDFTTRDAARGVGVTAFLTPDAELEDVEDLFDRARNMAMRVRATAVAARDREPRNPGRIISVISPKGGVGKTTVATNIAVGLANEDERVVLVDLDVQFGDVASALGISSRHTVVDALGKSAARDDFVLRTLLSAHSSGVSVLAAPESPAAADHLDHHRIGHLLRQLAAEFDHVIVDTAPGLSEQTIAAIEQSAAIVAVGGLDMASARGLRTTLELLRELQLLPRVSQLVLNAVERGVGLTVGEVERIVGMPVDVVVPRRRVVAIAGNHSLAVIDSAPRDPAAKALRRLVRLLDERLSRRELREVHEPRGRLRRLTSVGRAARESAVPRDLSRNASRTVSTEANSTEEKVS